VGELEVGGESVRRRDTGGAESLNEVSTRLLLTFRGANAKAATVEHHDERTAILWWVGRLIKLCSNFGAVLGRILKLSLLDFWWRLAQGLDGSFIAFVDHGFEVIKAVIAYRR